MQRNNRGHTLVSKAIGARDRQRRCREFVAGDTNEALRAYYGERSGSGILGDEAFRARVLAGKTPDSDRPQVRAAQVRPSVSRLGSCCTVPARTAFFDDRRCPWCRPS